MSGDPIQDLLDDPDPLRRNRRALAYLRTLPLPDRSRALAGMQRRPQGGWVPNTGQRPCHACGSTQFDGGMCAVCHPPLVREEHV